MNTCILGCHLSWILCIHTTYCKCTVNDNINNYFISALPTAPELMHGGRD